MRRELSLAGASLVVYACALVLASEPAENLRAQPRIIRVRIPPHACLAAPLRGDTNR